MPAIYAHYSFGRKVAKKLPARLRNIVTNYPEAYKAGLQGPDFLFYFNPLRKNKYDSLGHQIHEEKASDFLKNASKILAVAGMDSPEGAYILGFICHFVLDSACHGLINRNAGEKGISHTLQETEFDRYVMIKDGHDPFSLPLYKIPDASYELSEIISIFYKRTSTYAVRVCELHWRVIRRILHVEHPLKRRFLFHIGRCFFGKKAEYVEYVMKAVPDEGCVENNKDLFRKFEDAIPVAIREMIDFCLTIELGKPLSERFARNFVD